MKDRFSAHPGEYARFRPTCPDALVAVVLAQVVRHDRAWDAGTGNGQLARLLAPHFAAVEATDISAAQLSHAHAPANVRFSLSPAESTPFPAASFDLVVSAQAYHWFEHERYHAEARRLLVPGGVIAAIGYTRCLLPPELDPILGEFYRHVIGPYWDPERAILDAHFAPVPFPFRPVPVPPVVEERAWTLDELVGYIGTWSAVERYRTARGDSPLTEIRRALAAAWPRAGTAVVRIPYFARIGVHEG